MNGPQLLLPGDPAPRFQAPTSDSPLMHFDQAAGRYVVLSFFGSLGQPGIRKSVEHMVTHHRAWFDEANACFFGVGVDPADAQSGATKDSFPGIRYFRDFDGSVSRLYGVITPNPNGNGRMRHTPMTLVLDPMLRVLAVIGMDERHDMVFDSVVAALRGQGSVALPAPVLVLPRVFEPEFCAHLIAQFGAGEASGVMQDLDGKTKGVMDADIKKRRDCLIENAALREEIGARLSRRLLPAIRQSFNFGVTRIERYLLACYDAADASFFAAHRDNTTLGTAHRRFAVTINLNADYEGGDLMFPEFGLTTYRAPLGGAIVFSCALLHLVVPMTRGRRFAFLPFLHDDAAETVRQQNLQFTSSEIIHRN